MWPPLRTGLKRLIFGAMPASRLLRRGPQDRRRVALTFDDGPCPMTIELLDLLDQLNVPATFFVVGDRAEKYPELLAEYVRRGHQVAAHGFDHQRFTALSVVELDDQLRRTELAIGLQRTLHPWVRPPYGALSVTSLAQLAGTGRVIAMWSFDSEDYTRRDPNDLIERCSPTAIAAGDVVLFHEEQTWTCAALPKIVEQLRTAGFEFATMADLFDA